MSLNINVNFNEKDELWVFALEGDLDIYTSNKFKEEVLSAFKTRENDLEIDGSGLEYVDSTGLGVLISILKLARESERKIYLHNIKPNIKKIFNITELDKLFIFRGENDDQ